MITCPSCGNRQESGNFCESCGHAMLDQSSQIEGNPSFEKMKRLSKSFFQYAIERFKKPNLVFLDDEQDFPNALIAFFLLPFLIATFIYAILNQIYRIEFSGYALNQTRLPYFNLTSRLFIIFLLLLVCGYFANLLIMKITNHPISNKQLFSKYFGLQVPFLFIFAGLMLLSLLGIISINPFRPEDSLWLLILVTIVVVIMMVINPIIIAFHQLSLQRNHQSYYFTSLSFLINLLFMYIITKLLYESFINELINMF
ncbi:hypothetical protein [Amphibacillus indicireducens]|uniref:hypothetical protein n=1 Tax=Amphibacillus indicireducens TaxID=1076330 RepID=UPI0031EC19C1